MIKMRKKQREWLAALSKAADARVAHDNAVARRLGFADKGAAFRAMGWKFVDLARVDAPRIKPAQ